VRKADAAGVRPNRPQVTLVMDGPPPLIDTTVALGYLWLGLVGGFPAYPLEHYSGHVVSLIMLLGEGVEWGLHCCLVLAWLDDQAPIATARLAEMFELPSEYLKKRLQPLVREGILESTPGVRGGYRLARAPERISLMDVVAAVEERTEAFRCTEIRRHGAGKAAARSEFSQPCGIATAMRRAELAWRRELAGQTIADLIAAAPENAPARARRFYQGLTA
jgi:Rrf2 family protein